MPGTDPVESYFGRREHGSSHPSVRVPTDAATRSQLAGERIQGHNHVLDRAASSRAPEDVMTETEVEEREHVSSQK